ncbi:MAG: TMEM165/GDT1 family protein [Bacillota bacterium]
MELLTYVTTYLLIVLTELGDKTQLATLLLASNNPEKRWLVWGASSIALVLCVVIEVTVGSVLARYIQPSMINRITGVVFLMVGVYTLVKNLGFHRKNIKHVAQEAVTEI